jgi:hypothetical protein
MAVFLNNKVGVKINSVDISDHVSAVTLNRSFEELDVTAMGDLARRFTKGLEASSVTLSIFNDLAASNVTSTLAAAWGTTVTMVLLQDKGTAVSATNPLYTFSVLVNKTTDVNGNVGDMSTQDLTFTINGVVAITNSGTF